MKNSNDIIGNRSRDLPSCSAVPQPTAPPRAPPGKVPYINFNWTFFIAGNMEFIWKTKNHRACSMTFFVCHSCFKLNIYLTYNKARYALMFPALLIIYREFLNINKGHIKPWVDLRCCYQNTNFQSS
jgi:hypothetical protein